MTDILSTDSESFAVSIGAMSVGVSRGTVALDFTSYPYGRATVEIPLTDPAIINTLDPRNPLRCRITAGGRLFDLSARSTRAHQASGARAVTVEAATDEAILMAHKPLVDDLTPFTLAASLREVVRYVIREALRGSTLTLIDGPDADVTPLWEVTNLLRNPAVAGTTNNWSATGGCTIAYEPQDNPTSGYVKVTTVPGSSGEVLAVDIAKDNLNVTPGQDYTFALRARVLSDRMRGRLGMRFLDANGSTITTRYGAYGWVETTAQQIAVTFKAPANAATVRPFYSFAASSSTWQILLDGGMLHDADPRFPVAPFTGLDTNDDAYAYTFEGASNDSPSVRIPVEERDPESLVWGAGVSAWDFLEPLCASAGLRLFCDEQRRWFLIDPTRYGVSGSLTINAANLIEINDDTRLDDPDVYATGVLVRYRWENRHGVRMERHDTAGLPGVVRVIDFERPYPGPGTAQRVLERMRGRGRIHEATVVTNATAKPGMNASLTAPGTPTKTALVRAIEWGLTNGRMRVRLTDPPA